jgi:hypothetical protein
VTFSKPVAFLQIATGIGLILFWLAFFTIGLAPENPPDCYLAFEHSFPLPDMILALVLLWAGILMWKQNPGARAPGLAASGGLIFLGLIDFSFNIQNGMYLISTPDLIMNAFINLWCVGLGTTLFLSLRYK